jgi:large subunit ribosomal protein L28
MLISHDLYCFEAVPDDPVAGVQWAEDRLAVDRAGSTVLAFRPQRESGGRGARPRGEVQVARSCDVCGKRPVYGHQISHAHNVSSRVWLPNVQKVRVIVNRTRKRLRVCTRCLRSGSVVKAAS